MEREITIPFWSIIIKGLGIFDEDYHQKYREYIRQKRYAEYLANTRFDIYTKIFDARLKERIKKLIEEKFGKNDFVCPDPPIPPPGAWSR